MLRNTALHSYICTMILYDSLLLSHINMWVLNGYESYLPIYSELLLIILYNLWLMTPSTWATKKPRTFHCTDCLMGIRDPYNGFLKSPHNWVVFHLLYTLNNQGPFFSLLKWSLGKGGWKSPINNSEEIFVTSPRFLIYPIGSMCFWTYFPTCTINIHYS